MSQEDDYDLFMDYDHDRDDDIDDEDIGDDHTKCQWIISNTEADIPLSLKI